MSPGKKASDVLAVQLSVHSLLGASDCHTYLLSWVCSEDAFKQMTVMPAVCIPLPLVSGNQKAASPSTFMETPNKIASLGSQACE